MSKLGSLNQSMAALFTPESERVRKAQQDGGAPSSHHAPGAGKSLVNANGQMSDSLGNGHSPGGYEPPGHKRAAESGEEEPLTQPGFQVDGAPVPTFRPAGSRGPLIRLSPGFEKLLLAQQKLCEKAAALFTGMEAPDGYRTQRRGKLLQGKSRGCILDHTQQPEEAVPEKKSDDEAA